MYYFSAACTIFPLRLNARWFLTALYARFIPSANLGYREITDTRGIRRIIPRFIIVISRKRNGEAVASGRMKERGERGVCSLEIENFEETEKFRIPDTAGFLEELRDLERLLSVGCLSRNSSSSLSSLPPLFHEFPQFPTLSGGKSLRSTLNPRLPPLRRRWVSNPLHSQNFRGEKNIKNVPASSS